MLKQTCIIYDSMFVASSPTTNVSTVLWTKTSSTTSVTYAGMKNVCYNRGTTFECHWTCLEIPKV